MSLDKTINLCSLDMPFRDSGAQTTAFRDYGGPFGTVPELFFEEKQPIPELQQLLVLHCT